MPAAHKVGWAQLRVGLMAIAALVVVGVLVFLLTGSKKLFAKKDIVYTFMDDSAALATGSPVRLNGILAGEVTQVELSGEVSPQRVIRITMEIDREMMPRIPVDSVAALSAENVLGTKFINIRRGIKTQMVQPGGEIAARDSTDFEELAQQSYDMLAVAKGILKRIDGIVGLIESGKGSIGKLLVDEEMYRRLIGIVTEGQKIAEAMSKPTGTIGKLMYQDDVYNELRSSMAKMDTLLVDLNAGKGTAGKFLKDDALYSELRLTVADVRKVVTDLNAGKGTAGKLLKDEALHNQLQASLMKIDGIIDRISSGQGTIGQLLVNPAMYDSLNGATAEMRDLVKAVRENPKKYLRIKLALF